MSPKVAVSGAGCRKKEENTERRKFSHFLPSSLLSAPPIGQVPQSHCQESWKSWCVGEGVGGDWSGSQRLTTRTRQELARTDNAQVLRRNKVNSSEETKDAHCWEPSGGGSGARRYQRSGQGHRQQVKQSEQRQFYSRPDGKPWESFRQKKNQNLIYIFKRPFRHNGDQERRLLLRSTRGWKLRPR